MNFMPFGNKIVDLHPKWPLFRGAPTLRGCSYCPTHAVMAFAPIGPAEAAVRLWREIVQAANAQPGSGL